MAHKKGLGSSRNGRDSNPKYLGVKVFAGTLLLVPGLTEKDFDEIAAAGIRLVKFIFYDYSLLPNDEAERYVKWARERGIKVKIHSGGVSRSGVSQVAGVEIVKKIRPDIVGHITGGPIPMPEKEVEQIVAETDLYMEICSSGNPRMGLSLMRTVKAHNAFHRVLIGTDTPGGTGVIPRGMLREIALCLRSRKCLRKWGSVWPRAMSVAPMASRLALWRRERLRT